MRRLAPFLFSLTLIAPAAAAFAEVPRVATDIPAVRSLAAMVMEGVGEPEPILPAGGTPHEHALRPSEARLLQEADAVFWVGPALTPWLGDALETLGEEAQAVALQSAPGVEALPARSEPLFEEHDHAHDEHSQDGHSHGGPVDPHLWLDPMNARAWVRMIADTLAEIDPEHAETYRGNADAAASELEALTKEVEAALAPVRGQPYLVFHDAYRYFEERFGVPALGAVRLGDASAPGAARLAALRGLIEEEGVVCVFSEPQFPPALLASLVEGVPARAGTLDPVGATLPAGPDLYGELIRGLARDLTSCLDS